MNIVIVSHEYSPIGEGGANAYLYLVKNYATLGNKVTVLTACFKVLPRKEEIDNVHIVRVRALRQKENKSIFSEKFFYVVHG